MKTSLVTNRDVWISGTRITSDMKSRLENFVTLTGMKQSDIVRIALALLFHTFDQLKEKGRIVF